MSIQLKSIVVSALILVYSYNESDVCGDVTRGSLHSLQEIICVIDGEKKETVAA